MFRNYLKIAWRNITRDKASSFINIAGLSFGIASVLFIVLYVQDELQYDKFLKDAGLIYQVNVNGNIGGQEFIAGATPPPAGAALVAAFPEIETFTRIFDPGNTVVGFENNNGGESYFPETGIRAVDANFLEVFSFKLKEGTASTCLQEINAVVLTEKAAKKYFENSSAIGKTLRIGDDKNPFTVTGILYDLPSQSSLQFDMLVPVDAYPVVKRFSWSWVWLQMITYVKLKGNISNADAVVTDLESKFPGMVEVQASNAFDRIGQPWDEFRKNGGKWDLQLQPLTAIHLYSGGIESRLTTLSDIKYVYIFSIIALFIIILACVNFMNLSTAQSAKRAKEVGIRKVLGSTRNRLIKQFLTEAMLFTLLSALTAIILVAALLQPFNLLIEKSLELHSIFTNFIWLFLLAVILVTGLLAGSYPAFYLTSFKPSNTLKGTLTLKNGIGDLFIRNGLVIFQFTVSTILIICTIIVFQQLHFMQDKDLGLQKENVIIIPNTNRLAAGEKTFRDEVMELPEVAEASIATSIPTGNNFTDGYVPEPSSAKEQLAKDISLTSFIVDHNFVPALRLQVLKGRNFSSQFADSASVILNETAVKQIGWQDPVGQFLYYPGNGNQRFKVIGVVRDFNIQSLHNIVVPFALFDTSSKTYDIGTSYIITSVKPGSIVPAIQKLHNKWNSFAPSMPFEYSFLDDEYNALYRKEERMGVVFTLFTTLSIIVGAMGLFGLTAYTAERRTKEIGIRKVLGASGYGIVVMLSKDFVKMVLIASVIAFPIAWWGMDKWLQDFAYRMGIDWWIFLISAMAALLIALLTTGYKALKTANVNPAKSLHME